MTPTLKKLIVAVAVGAASAIVTDLKTFNKARQADHKTEFDWSLCVSRAVDGAMTGGLLALGVEAAGG